MTETLSRQHLFSIAVVVAVVVDGRKQESCSLAVTLLGHEGEVPWAQCCQ